MNYTERNSIPGGVLMMIDFEKAFDSISWDFIYQTLDRFNFGQPIKDWVKNFIMILIHVSYKMDSLQNILNLKEDVGRVTQFRPIYLYYVLKY